MKVLFIFTGICSGIVLVLVVEFDNHNIQNYLSGSIVAPSQQHKIAASSATNAPATKQNKEREKKDEREIVERVRFFV